MLRTPDTDESRADLDSESAADSPCAPVDNWAVHLPKTWNAFFAPVDIAFLVAFRITIGLILLYHALDYASSGELRDFFVPQFHFKYYGWEWVSIPGEAGVYLLFTLMGLSAFFVAIGFCYRFSAAFMFVTFLWSFLAERCLYNNHYYLTALIAFWFIFLPAAQTFSVDAWLARRWRANSPPASQYCPAWCLGMLRFLVGLPYVFGAIAKLNSDWLNCEPMRLGMALKKDRVHVLLGQFFEQEWMVALFSYGGLLLDLLIVPALLYKPTRWIAFGFGVVFHLLNMNLFDIGYFPYLMIPATLVFFDPSWPRGLAATLSVAGRFCSQPFDVALNGAPAAIRRWRLTQPAPLFDAAAPLTLRRRLFLGFVLLFCGFQASWPLRHYLIEGDPSWTEEGHLFSWHMMLRNKICLLLYLKKDRETGEMSLVNYHPSAKEAGGQPYLTDRQAMKLGKDPHMLVQYAHFLAQKEKEKTGKDYEIHAISFVSLNGRRPRLIVNPKIDLTTVEPGWKLLNAGRAKDAPLILPLDEPLRIPAYHLDPKFWLDPSLPPEVRVVDSKTLALLPDEFTAWLRAKSRNSGK